MKRLYHLFLFLGLLVLTSPLFSHESHPFEFVREFNEMGWDGVVTIAVLLCALVAMVKEVRPPDVVMLVSAGVLALFGTLTPQQLLRGFSSDIIVTIALLCVVVRALEVNGILDQFSKWVLPEKSSPRRSMASLLFPVSTLSAFLNNTVIVLMMTPVVRKWALKQKLVPSKFLIPLSYASIVGGLCTLIGTSTNIIVDSLMRKHDPTVGLSFFELAWVGVPCALIALGFVILVGYTLLPNRQDVTSAMVAQATDFTGEFTVEEGSPISGKLVKDVSGKYFHGELLAEIERAHRTITAPGPYDVILPGDRLVFAGDINQIAELHTIEGLQSCADPHFQLDEMSSHFSEVVIAITSSLTGKTVRSVNFRKRYGASVFAVYRQGRRLPGNVGDVILDAGDTLVILSTEEWEGDQFSRDFYYIRHKEKLTIFKPARAAIIGVILAGMVGMALAGVSIMLAVMAAALFLLFSRSISFREAQNSILWNVLLLIASSFAVATAVETTGVATFFAKMLLAIVGSDPYWVIGGVLVVTCLFTEMLSNNAAALLLFPIALQTARLAGYDGPEALKSIGIAIAVGSSCGFALPTGYQTHMIVYGPGGYKFRDFMRIGLFMDLIILAIAMGLIPTIWPLF